MINNVVLVGRVANDPEMKYTTSGMAVTSFRMAVDRGRKDQNGNDQTDWLDIVCFQKTAELVAQYFDKGAMIGIEGRIQSRTWETNEGQKRYSVEIVANRVSFLESKAEADRRRAAKGQTAPSAPGGGAPSAAFTDDFSRVPDNEDPFGDQ
jgi:single-strand DNA-binding protein